jgi:uncharacterized RDD family membrane protein YckC
MSTTEPPAGSTPPPGEPTPPPPPPMPANPATVPPPDSSMAPPPPPPPMGASAPVPGAPAGVYGAGQPGSLMDRFLARLIDFIIIGIVGFIIRIVLAAISDSWLLANLIDAVVTTVLYLGYFGYLESNRGQTIGKQVMKLKTVGPDGHSNPTMNEAIKRNIWLGAAILGVVPILGALLGGLIELAAIIIIAVNINSDPQRQHWFDKFAGGTKVVKIG